MKIKNDTFSIRLLNNIKKLVLVQLVFIGVAMSTYSYFSFTSELKATERLILGQLMTSITKMLDYGEILYVQPLLESTVKASEGRFKVFVTLKKSSSSDLIAFSGDSSVLGDIFKLQLVTKQSAPYFGEIQVGLTIGYIDQVIKSIWLLILVISTCALLSYSLFWYIKKGVSTQSFSVDELELVMNSIDTKLDQSDSLTKAKTLILEYSNNKAQTFILESLAMQAKQVAHDIRSPLTALNLVMGSAKELPEDKRLLIRNAVQRINDIANNLLTKSKASEIFIDSAKNIKQVIVKDTVGSKFESLPDTEKPKTYLLSSLIESIVSEKRIEYRDKINVHIEADLNQAYGLFTKIDSHEFQRILSNLINNSVEALVDDEGEVKISVRGYKDTIVIVLFDNGRGIPEHILEKLGEAGVSYGKDGTNAGSGLGVSHAKKTIENFGGRFNIQSRLGEGTMVNIILNRATAPDWFVQEIFLNSNAQLISVDDDVSIHQVWTERLKELGISESIKHISFATTQSFIDWFSANNIELNTSISDTLFLIDYEFLSDSMTGLDLIEKLSISKRAILVTSHFEETKIRSHCESSGVKLIPKSMAGIVPISLKF